jgi:hypothetical protein
MKFKNDFLNLYLEAVEDTESPRIFHIWSALSGISACLGRRCFLDMGIGPLWPNMYVCLVGPPGVRKSTALSIMKQRLKGSTNIRFAQDDTSGQRQGLIKALHGNVDDDGNEIDKAIQDAIHSSAPNTLDNIANIDLGDIPDPRDEHALYVTASEFNTFIGHNSIDMLTFLAKMWDGEDYDYRIKNSRIVLSNPLLNLLGATTPTNIATAMPVEAVGQGFMSRLILVYSNQKYKRVPRPRPLPEILLSEIEAVYNYANKQIDGEFRETIQAKRALDEVYDEDIKITDTRFVYYCERRHVHLIKLTMALCASRRSMEIQLSDVEEALVILRATEAGMPEALGEYGLSPLASAKQKLIEFVRSTRQAVSTNVLWAVMQRDMKNSDFHTSLADLVNAGKLMKVQTATGDGYIAPLKDTKRVDDVLAHLAAEENKSNEQDKEPDNVIKFMGS